ncbi:hypothetical protein AGMMS50267_11300 [Spirochaetia bacterium]|nr:hypothetical protein AGMMS50267_11300 [Spirochaetia bacterium]
MDVSGINRIGLIPVSYSDARHVYRSANSHSGAARVGRSAKLYSDATRSGRLAKQTADELDRLLYESLIQTGKFKVVTSAEIDNLERQGEPLVNYVDALLAGTLNTIRVIDDTGTSTRNGKDGKTENVTTYSRTVTVEFTYQLLNAGDRSIIGYGTKGAEARSTDYSSNPHYLTSPYDLAAEIIKSQLENFYQDVVPYPVIEKRRLTKETSNDKTVKDQMKEVLSLVKNKSYRQALTGYQKIYADSGEFAAGYNAAIMTEVLGDLNNAIALMSSLYGATGNPQARTELARMQSTFIAEEKYNSTDGGVTAAIQQLVSKLTASVSDTSILSVINVSYSEKQLADFVVDELASSLANNPRFPIIDRQNSNRITAERQFLLLDAVSAESAASIGHELGVNTLVLCSITGTDSLRRLTVRVIDVESTQLVFQSVFEI